MAERKQADPFYKSKRWEQKRKAILRRDGYMDQVQKRYGKRIPANTVHHIFPREDFPEYGWSSWNMIAVSHDTHNKLHDRATGKLTEEGQDLLLRTARRMNIEINTRKDEGETNGEDI